MKEDLVVGRVLGSSKGVVVWISEVVSSEVEMAWVFDPKKPEDCFSATPIGQYGLDWNPVGLGCLVDY